MATFSERMQAAIGLRMAASRASRTASVTPALSWPSNSVSSIREVAKSV